MVEDILEMEITVKIITDVEIGLGNTVEILIKT